MKGEASLEPWPALARALGRHAIPKEVAYQFMGVNPRLLQRTTNPMRRKLMVERVVRVTRALDAAAPDGGLLLRALAGIVAGVDPGLGIPSRDDPI